MQSDWRVRMRSYLSLRLGMSGRSFAVVVLAAAVVGVVAGLLVVVLGSAF